MARGEELHGMVRQEGRGCMVWSDKGKCAWYVIIDG